MDDQLGFNFEKKTEKLNLSDPDIGLFINFLENCNWTLSDDIQLFLDLTPANRKRKLRSLAEASDGQRISGSRGYKLTRNATSEEIQHCSARLRSQATSMTRRAMAIDRVYHNRK